MLLTLIQKSGGSNTVSKYSDIEEFKLECGVNSVMLARAAMWNCSVFRKQGLVQLDDVIKRFLKIVKRDIF
jgi:tRNA-dihydrouridine synthase 2